MNKELSIITKGAGFYFGGFLISKVLAFLYRAMLARSLQPEAFGIFSIALGIMGLVIVFAALGLYQGILHFTAVYDSVGNQAKARGTILFGLKAQLIASIILSAGIFLSADYIALSVFREPELAMVLKILSLTLPLSVITSALMVVVLAFKKIKYKIYVRNIFENVTKLVFTGALILAGFQLFGATLGLALSYVAAFIISLYFVQKKVFPIFGKNLKSEYNARELFSYSWPLLAVGFFGVIMTSIDTIMLGALGQIYDAGIYNVAQPTANLLVVVPFAFGALFLPVITGLYAQKKMAEMGKMFKIVSRWTFALVFPCLLFTVLFSREILVVMFGSLYAQGAAALSVLAVGIFMVSFVGPVRSILESIKRTKLIFFNTILCGLLNIGLNLWLIPLFGASGAATVGAALATSMSFFLWNLLALGEVFILTKLHPYSKSYLAPTIAACIAIALFYFVKQVAPNIGEFSFPLDFALLVFFGCTFLAVYALLFIVFRGLQSEDLDVLKAIEAKTGFKVNFARDFIKRFS